MIGRLLCGAGENREALTSLPSAAIVAAAASVRSAVRLTIASRAPSDPSRCATPRLMPLDAPTTTATRPDRHCGSRDMVGCFLCVVGEKSGAFDGPEIPPQGASAIGCECRARD